MGLYSQKGGVEGANWRARGETKTRRSEHRSLFACGGQSPLDLALTLPVILLLPFQIV